jgi:hypothetical protein
MFNYTPDASTNFDHVKDFTEGEDTLFFARDAFTALRGSGAQLHLSEYDYHALKTSEFQIGNSHAADNADVRVLYDKHNGILYYDSNGSGSGHLEEIAQLSKGLHLTADDVFVF